MGSLLILTFVFGFAFGVVAIVAAEALGVFIILNKLSKRSQKDFAKANAKLEQSEPDPLQSLEFLSHKQVFYGARNILEISVCNSQFRFCVLVSLQNSYLRKIYGNFILAPSKCSCWWLSLVN